MSSPIPAKRLYLKGLGKDISIDELSKFLSTYGEVLEVKFVHNYAFVEYASEADAQLVYNIYRTEPLLGKHVIIQYARPLRKAIAAAARSREMAENRSPVRERRDGLSRHPVVVSGLSPDVRWQDLKDFGRSTGCLVAFCDLDRSDPDTGFLEYFTKEDAEYAVQSLDGKPLGGNVVRVLSYHDVSTLDFRRRISDEMKGVLVHVLRVVRCTPPTSPLGQAMGYGAMPQTPPGRGTAIMRASRGNNTNLSQRTTRANPWVTYPPLDRIDRTTPLSLCGAASTEVATPTKLRNRDIILKSQRSIRKAPSILRTDTLFVEGPS
ncbi:hypothetical protein DFP72DRAFT_1060962 [Ephemerocybe angulata]|uniref:RRM domain-containing protein n=1 Tax=Ephemerocybe angulata TaxID=980116 RepID=A0A8H6MF19_9AGAR|nr:hypothetical protein DFP72DRAFT_1060962 [Tulosesus angulatus]